MTRGPIFGGVIRLTTVLGSVLCLAACATPSSDARDGSPPDGAPGDGRPTGDAPVDAAPDAPWYPAQVTSGLPDLDTALWTDLGPADGTTTVRVLLSLRLRDRSHLEARVGALYDPASPDFRRYLDRAEWIAEYAPTDGDLAAVRDWLASEGFTESFAATGGLYLVVTGTAADVERSFGLRLHHLEKPGGNLNDLTFGAADAAYAPAPIAARLQAILAVDEPASTSTLPGEAGDIETTPPAPGAHTPAELARAYHFDTLYAAGVRGAGQKIGIVVAYGFKRKDVQSFWQSAGITRPDPVVRVTQEPPSTRVRETAIDVEWSGALAPEAGLVVYQAPDSREGPLLFAFHEAVAGGVASVVTDSFAHSETAVTRPIREAYDTSALIGAAMGVTIVAASGDSARTDVPSSSPHVTAVGGTVLETDAGDVMLEVCWSQSGSGDALSFDRPPWQPGTFAHRAIADVGLASGSAYWVYYLGDWELNGGTSFASPVFSAAVALVNQRRALDGKPAAGFINPALYRDPEVQATFRDVTTGGTDMHPCGPGWDRPSGWGAPNVAALADALP